MDVRPTPMWLIPAAIIFAGLILSIAIFVLRVNSVAIPDGGKPEAVRPVSPEDHIVGSPEAPVVIVEYSDIDSEYGKTFHAALSQLMTEYAEDGRVAWVYRHFPLTTMHRNAFSHAEAAECAGSLGAPDAFWRFIDLANSIAPGSVELDPDTYPTIVNQLGINQQAFEECRTAGRFSKRILDDIHNAVVSGAEGAPYTVILIRGQEPIAINGALPYDSLKQAVDHALNKL